MSKQKKNKSLFRLLLFFSFALTVTLALGVLYVVYKGPVKINAGASGQMVVEFKRPRVYAHFVDAGGKLAACDSLENTTCNTPNYTYWPGSSVAYYLRVKDVKSGSLLDIKSGKVTANSSGSVKVSWTLDYEVQAFLSSKANCGDSGSECQKQTILASTNTDLKQVFLLLRADYNYRIIVCTPNCAYKKPQIVNKEQKSLFPGNMECAADVNWDGIVNSGDMLMISRNYGPVPSQYLVTPSPYDMNFDKVVDPTDLNIAAGQFNKLCPIHKQ